MENTLAGKKPEDRMAGSKHKSWINLENIREGRGVRRGGGGGSTRGTSKGENLPDPKWRANKTKTITLFTQLYAPGVRKNDF